MEERVEKAGRPVSRSMPTTSTSRTGRAARMTSPRGFQAGGGGEEVAADGRGEEAMFHAREKNHAEVDGGDAEAQADGHEPGHDEDDRGVDPDEAADKDEPDLAAEEEARHRRQEGEAPGGPARRGIWVPTSSWVRPTGAPRMREMRPTRRPASALTRRPSRGTRRVVAGVVREERDEQGAKDAGGWSGGGGTPGFTRSSISGRFPGRSGCNRGRP